MRIAFVSQPWNTVAPPVQTGAIAIWTYEVARRLAQSHDVTVLSRMSSTGQNTERDDGVEYRPVPSGGDAWLATALKRPWRFLDAKRPLFASGFYYPSYIRHVARHLRRAPCDIVHIHNLSQFVPLIRSSSPAAAIVLHMHCEWLTQLDRAMVARRLQMADLVLGCSRYITTKIREAFPQFASRCRTVPNAVDVRSFAAVPGDAQPRRNGPRLLFVGRISPEKGLHVLLEAFRQVADQHPQAHLEIVGPDAVAPREFIVALSDQAMVADLARFYPASYLSHLKRQVSGNGRGTVAFAGRLEHSRLVAQYKRADILVSPSLSDASSMPAIEAMAVGLPVVATRVGGVPELVQDGRTGLLVNPGDPDALADAISRLLVDEELRRSMGRAGRERAAREFSWERVANDLLVQYRELCEDSIAAAGRRT